MSGGARKILARSGRTFHLASLFLPARTRTEAADLYAFCRGKDDLADEGAGDSFILQNVKRTLVENPTGPEAAAFGWPVDLERHYPGLAEVAAEHVSALADDTGARTLRSEGELLRYAWGVAGTVGLMMRRVLGATAEADGAASDLGIAMQLTNIARDVKEDRERKRFYLPSEWITPEDVCRAVDDSITGGGPQPPDVIGAKRSLIEATLRLLALADQFYAKADAGMHFLPWRARLSILAAAGCYREIGVMVAADVPASWSRRTVVGRTAKLALIARAISRLGREPERLREEEAQA